MVMSWVFRSIIYHNILTYRILQRYIGRTCLVARMQLNTNIIWGLVKRAQLLWNVRNFCETCTTSLTCAQHLWNVHNISETCTTFLKRAQHLWNVHICNIWKHWVGAVKHVIPITLFYSVCIYVYIHRSMYYFMLPYQFQFPAFHVFFHIQGLPSGGFVAPWGFPCRRAPAWRRHRGSFVGPPKMDWLRCPRIS